MVKSPVGFGLRYSGLVSTTDVTIREIHSNRLEDFDYNNERNIKLNVSLPFITAKSFVLSDYHDKVSKSLEGF